MVSTTVIRQYSDGEPKLEELFGRKGLIDNPKPPSLIEKFVNQTTSNNEMVLDFFAGSGTTGQAVIEANRKDKSHRSFVLVEVGAYFDSVLVPRIKKVVFSPEWSAGKPNRIASLDEIRNAPGIIKVLRLESYEDTLNNLSLTNSDRSKQAVLLEKNPELRESYMLSYMLDVETRDGLVNLRRFEHPFDTKISVVRGDEVRLVKIDLIETFNYLLGLHVLTMRRIKDVFEVVGLTRSGDQALILWRDVAEVDNDALDEWFRKQAYSSRDKEFDLIYVNGDNNIENLRRTDETWKVRLIEEIFLGLLFSTGVA